MIKSVTLPQGKHTTTCSQESKPPPDNAHEHHHRVINPPTVHPAHVSDQITTSMCCMHAGGFCCRRAYSCTKTNFFDNRSMSFSIIFRSRSNSSFLFTLPMVSKENRLRQDFSWYALLVNSHLPLRAMSSS